VAEAGTRATGWVRDEFLTACLDRPVIRVQDLAAAAQAVEHARTHPRWMVEARVPVDQVASLGRLTGQGFRLIDTNVQLDCAVAQLGAAEATSKEWSIRPAAPVDREVVVELAATQMSLSRFHLDPGIEPAFAAAVKRAWVGNFFESRRGDGLYVVDTAAGIAGFLLVLERGTQGIIDLIAVQPRVRGTGVVAALVGAWVARSPQLDRLLVGTQIANFRSLRAYAKLGFKVCAAAHVLHKHPDEARGNMNQEEQA